jgi:FtsP/CotA-like multicopper oxidase with cupredoxin domain
MNWDYDLGPVMVSDWVHQSAYTVFQEEMAGRAPTTNNTLVNGKGTFNTSASQSTGSKFETCFTPGKKHLLRLVNGAISSDYRFSIDNHVITVIATDFVAIKPYNTTSLFMGIGQRYTVVVQALESRQDHWLRTIPASNGCSNFGNPQLLANATGIIRYQGTNSCLSPPVIPPTNASTACVDEPMSSLHPIVPWIVDPHPLNDLEKDSFYADLQTGANTDRLANYSHWFLKDEPLWLDFGNPTILNLEEPDSDFSPNYAIVDGQFSLL